MRLIKLSLAFTFLLLILACKNNTDFPVYSYNDTTYLSLHFKDIRTPFNYTLFFVNLIPPDERKVDLTTTKDTNYQVRFPVSLPTVVNLTSEQLTTSFFCLPHETLDIKIDLSPFSKSDGKISYKGKSASISEYLTKKKYDISSWPKYFESVEDYSVRVDYLIKKGLETLYKFNEKESLPDWFIKQEESDITYSGARDKIFQFKIRYRYNFKYRIIPKHYLDQLGIRYNNPDAKYSLSYYGFINNYSTLNLYDYIGRQKVSPEYSFKYIASNILYARKALGKDVRDYYIAHRVCILLSDSIISEAIRTGNNHYFQRVDSLFDIVKSNIRDPSIKATLNDYQKKQSEIVKNLTLNK